jgi:hypothetical protein
MPAQNILGAACLKGKSTIELDVRQCCYQRGAWRRMIMSMMGFEW